MKQKQLIIMLLLAAFLLSGFESVAQRRVIDTPRRTVVQSPRGTVVYRKRPVVRPVRRLPATAVVVRHSGNSYYFNAGAFYTLRGGVYVRVVPPVGIRVAVLPAEYVRVVVGARPFFYFSGIFYALTETREYVVVDPPVGAVVAKLPADAAEVEIDGKLFYECNGTIYKPVPAQHRSYEVVGNLKD